MIRMRQAPAIYIHSLALLALLWRLFPDLCSPRAVPSRCPRMHTQRDTGADGSVILGFEWSMKLASPSRYLNMHTQQIHHMAAVGSAIGVIGRSLLHDRWSAFVPTLHYGVKTAFEQSRIARWPRRSCESLLYPMVQGVPCEDFPVPSTDSLLELQAYAADTARHEEGLRQRAFREQHHKTGHIIRGPTHGMGRLR